MNKNKKSAFLNWRKAVHSDIDLDYARRTSTEDAYKSLSNRIEKSIKKLMPHLNRLNQENSDCKLLPSISIEKIDGKWFLTSLKKVRKSENHWRSNHWGGGSWETEWYTVTEKVILDEPELCFCFKLNSLVKKLKSVLHKYRWEYLTKFSTSHIMYDVEDILEEGDFTMEEIYNKLPYKNLQNLNQALKRLRDEGSIYKIDDKYSLDKPSKKLEKKSESKRLSLRKYVN